MADFTIGRFNVIASNVFATAQMRIRRLSPDPLHHPFGRSSCWNSQARRVERGAPQIGATPIIGIPVIPEVCGLVLPGDGLVRVDVGAILNLLFRQRHIQSLGLKVRLDYREWREKHSAASKPAAGVYHEVADGPCIIVEIELIDRSKLAVRSSDPKTLQLRPLRSPCLQSTT